MSVRMEIGENRAPKFGVPTWAGEWPVLIDGSERAVIVETERGYRLREGDGWTNPERGCRSQAEDDARNRYLTWATENGHPFTRMRYEVADVNGEQWARLTVAGEVVHGPDVRTERVYAEFNRRYADAVRELDE